MKEVPLKERFPKARNFQGLGVTSTPLEVDDDFQADFKVWRGIAKRGSYLMLYLGVEKNLIVIV